MIVIPTASVSQAVGPFQRTANQEDTDDDRMCQAMQAGSRAPGPDRIDCRNSITELYGKYEIGEYFGNPPAPTDYRNREFQPKSGI